MKKQLIIVVIIFLFCFISGCTTTNDINIDEKSVISIIGLEAEIHNLINNERQSYGLAPLEYDTMLAQIARAHSVDMASRNYFSHTNPEGQGPTERAKAADYNCYKNFGTYFTDGIAENIFKNSLYSSVSYYNGVPVYDWNSQSKIACSTVAGWMNSSGHRENILRSIYDKEGIGVALSSDYAVYITQDFW